MRKSQKAFFIGAGFAIFFAIIFAVLLNNGYGGEKITLVIAILYGISMVVTCLAVAYYNMYK